MKYITIPQLAKILGLSRVTVYRKVKSSEIPATKVGHAYVISNTEISEILGEELSEKSKKKIDKAIKKVFQEYGETLRLLGRE